MNILITGAGGFIGKSFILKNKDHKIFAIYNNDSFLHIDNSFYLNLHNKKHILKLIHDLKNTKIDVIIHLAGHTPFHKKNINFNFSKELLMTKNMCMLCNTLHITKLLYSSGWIIYGSKTKVPYKENSLLQPDTDYGKSKLLVESYFKKNLFNTKCINLRLSSIYGPGQISNGLIPNLLNSAIYKNKICISDVNIKRNYLFIYDLIKIINKLTNLKIKSSLDINIAHSSSFSILEIAQIVKDIVENNYKSSVEIEILNNNIQVAQAYNNQLDISLLKKYYPKISFTSIKKGIKDYLLWILNTSSIVFDFDGTITSIEDRWYNIHKDLAIKYKYNPLPKSKYLHLKRNKIDERSIMPRVNIITSKIPKYIHNRLTLLESEKYLLHDTLKPKCKILLEQLSKSYKLILLSNRNNRTLLLNELKTLHIDNFFMSVLTGYKNNKYEVLKKYWSTKNMLIKYIIGDTETDFELSEKFGIQSILLADGGRSKTYLKKFKKAIILDSIKELSKIVIIDHAKTLLHSSNR
jgi:nucleoside-diphosphate-sugar epimerase/phosphoglycolate phosphatase-like HAD superfamily hydrolase